VSLLRHLPAQVTNASAPLYEGDLSGLLEFAVQELRASVDCVREYSDMLETYVITDEPRCVELREITREIRAQAEFVRDLIEAAFTPEAT